MHPEAMRVHAPATVRPDFAQILARVRNLRPQIEERALAAEKAKRVPAETMEALRDTTVFRLMQPARFGGYEYGPAELAEVGFELGRACGSTGWCGTLAVCFGWMTSFFPLQAQRVISVGVFLFFQSKQRLVSTPLPNTCVWAPAGSQVLAFDLHLIL